jgi:hypothetical protein
VIPYLVASPDRGRSCASYPDGKAIANPQGTKAIRPGSSRIVDLTAALTSIPAAPTDSYAGSGTSSPPDIRLIGIEMSECTCLFYLIRHMFRAKNRLPIEPDSDHSHEVPIRETTLRHSGREPASQNG